MAAYPELQNLTVNVHHWLTSEQLIHIYSVGQMAPGPNMMMVAAVGEQVSGIPGALIAAFAFFVPTGFLTFGVGRLWTKLEHWPWRASIQKGLAPVAIGLAVAGTISFGRGAVTNWITRAHHARNLRSNVENQDQSRAADSRRRGRRRYRSALTRRLLDGSLRGFPTHGGNAVDLCDRILQTVCNALLAARLRHLDR